MKLFWKGTDGGPKSTVTGYWLVEWKGLFSVALLKFGNGGRYQFHSHAFGSVSWVLSGGLREEHLGGEHEHHRPSLRPVVTRRSTFHRVFSRGTSWVLTFRGPWKETWEEYDRFESKLSTLKDGRVVSETRFL